MTAQTHNSQPRAGKLFVVAGIDGSGKSTLLSLLARSEPGLVVGSYDPHIWVHRSSFEHLKWMLEQNPREVVGRLPAAARASFLGHLVLCHWESWLRPRLENDAIVFLDSYFFRFWARERAWKGEYLLLERMVCHLPEADRTFLINVHPKTAAHRKTSYDACETGGSQDNSLLAFVQFQQKVADELRHACYRWSKKVVEISGDHTPEQIVCQIMNSLHQHQEVPNDNQ